MGTVQAGAPSGQGTVLRDLAHDLRSAVSATTAYVDLAEERLARGEAVEAEDLQRIARGLTLINGAVERLDAVAKGASR